MLKMFQLVSFATELISKQTNKYATLDWRKVTKGYKSRFRSVVSSREHSAATDEEKNNKIVFSKTCTNCDLRQFDFDFIADRAVLPSRPP